MHVSAGTQTAPYVNATSGKVEGSLDLEIGTLTWEEKGSIYFQLRQKSEIFIKNARVHGTCMLWSINFTGGVTTYGIVSQCPWTTGGFTPFEIDYLVGMDKHRYIINVNVYCSMNELAAAMNEACGPSS